MTDTFKFHENLVEEYKRLSTSFTSIRAPDIRQAVETIRERGDYWPEPLVHALDTPTLFRDDLPRWQHLIHPLWLAQLLEGWPVEAAPRGGWCLFEVDSGPADAFLQSHIPGAAYLDTELLEHTPLWNAVPDAQLLGVLAHLGITLDTPVLLYGRNTTAAARAAHLMLYAGVADVRLLDGGFAAWMQHRLPVAAGPARRYRPRSDFGSAQPLLAHYMADLQQAKALLAQPGHAVLASIRSWEEHTGLTSGYRYIAAKGDIPGAVWGRAGEGTDVNSMRAYQQPDGRMLPAAEIGAFWREAGIVPEKTVCFYCGTGWRASLAFFYAWLMGWEHISVFDGGWFEWSSDPRNLRTLLQ